MQDGIIAGNGNSRYLKTVAAALSFYPTYQDFMTALIAGTFPIDLNGINEAGWSQLGTALNKANLLTDATASAIGVSSNATPNTAMNQLNTKINTNNNNVNARFNSLKWEQIGTANLYGLRDGQSFSIQLSKSISTFYELMIEASNVVMDGNYYLEVDCSNILLEHNDSPILACSSIQRAASSGEVVPGRSITLFGIGSHKSNCTYEYWSRFVDASYNLITDFQSGNVDMSSVTNSLSCVVSGREGRIFVSGVITVYGRSNP